jgi:hypothetical protein
MDEDGVSISVDVDTCEDTDVAAAVLVLSYLTLLYDSLYLLTRGTFSANAQADNPKIMEDFNILFFV